MAEIQMTPTWPSRAEAAPEAAAMVAGDAGFVLMPPVEVAAWPMSDAMPGGSGAGASAPDPLTRWLEGMLGMTADFAAPPATDPQLPPLGASPVPTEKEVVPTDEALASAAGPELWPVDGSVDPAADLPASVAPPSADVQPPVISAATGIAALGDQHPTDRDGVAPPAPQAAAAPVSGPAEIARDLGMAVQAPAPAMPAGGADPGMTGASEAFPPAPVARRSEQPSGPPLADPAAADRGEPADPRAEMRPAAPAAADPAGRPAPRTATARTEPPDPGGRSAAEAADPSVPLRDAGLASRAGSLPSLDQIQTLPGTDARPMPEFRMSDLSRPNLSVGVGGPQIAPDPRPVIRQITDAMVTTQGDRTEIALSPEELGRIRLVMSGPDRSQITFWAERPETLDLVRRHADLLTQQLAEAGVRADSLDFRHSERGPGSTAAPSDPAEQDETYDAPPALRVSLAPAPLSDRRIDIRL